MKKLVYLPVLIVLSVLISCSGEESGEEIDASLVGTWSGTYSGDDRGVWNVTVSSTGRVSGTAVSGFTSDSQEINGRVNSSGSLSATLGNTEDREFVGQLSGSNEASGTWVDTGRDFSGSWVGQKN